MAGTQRRATGVKDAPTADPRQQPAAADERSRDLIDRLLDSFDNDRAELAGRLHDGPLQMTTAVRLMADSLRHSLDAGDLARARTALEKLERYAAAAAEDLRLTTQRLHPVVMRHGLVQALGSLAETAAEEHTVAVTFHPPESDWPGDGQRDAALLQIAREAIANAARNGRPPIEVALRIDSGQAVLTVTDHGPGPGEAAGLGLQLINARAGRAGAGLDWRSDAGQSSLVVRIPAGPHR